jgi:hypothetical protein
VLIRAVNTRDRTLPQFIEVPLTAQLLRRVATVLEDFATQAEAETLALHRRRPRSEGHVLPLETHDPV